MTMCSMTALVDRHFARRIRPPQERVLRQHLPGCTRCGKRYRRQLVLAQLDPRAPADEVRLAVGLGLRPVARPWLVPAAAAALAAAVAIALVASRDRGGDDAPAFAQRGADATRLVAYRVAAGGRPEPVTRSIARGDELAFAYENAAAHRYLLVFGVDEHRHVYWFHPAWDDPLAAPAAVPIQQGARLVELPEAVAHSYDGGRLVIHGVFTDQPASVRDAERWALGQGPQPRGEHVEIELEVTP
jgi:hypothetical protein